MRLSDFDYDLPEDRIALRPLPGRLSARQLIIPAEDGLRDDVVRNLPVHLRPGDCLVFNDTRVLPTRLSGRVGNANVDINLIERVDAFTWRAFIKNGRRVKTDRVIECGHGVTARMTAKGDDGQVTLRFDIGAFASLDGALAVVGQMPLPPYIASRRAVDARDDADYQTIFAARDGAVAAPTASLHFTPELLAALDARGITRAAVTLHVGAGTFLPVKVDDVKDHVMHAEWGEVGVDTARIINETRMRGGNVVAVGTTALRIVETAADETGAMRPFAGDTRMFITPGYRFRAIDRLMTNFHLPKSTLFMLVSALAGLPRMKMAYAHAIENNYRFFSYGDSCLIDAVHTLRTRSA